METKKRKQQDILKDTCQKVNEMGLKGTFGNIEIRPFRKQIISSNFLAWVLKEHVSFSLEWI